MELEEMKSMWKEHNSILGKYAAMNEELLKNTYTQKTHGVIDNLLHWEIFSLIEFMIFLLFTSVATYTLMDDVRFLLSGCFMILFFIPCIILSIPSIRLLLGISLYSQSIIDVKHSILTYKKRANQFMKIFWFIIPLIVVAFIPLGVKFVRNICLYDYPVLFLIIELSTIILGYVIAFISYQTIINRKYKIIEKNLEALEIFKGE
jgi:hypothetical protein